ncbi:MAG: polysaccharide deacetylase family protein [Jiangellaceae bacterium]
MANGSSGAAVTGLVIGVILAAQTGDWGSDDGADSDGSAAQSSEVGDGPGSSSSFDNPDADRPDGAPSGLEVPGVITTTGRSGTTVALTFSTGPDPRYTPEVLETLADHGVTATFCVLGVNARDHAALVRTIVAEGHTLCDHSTTHDFALATRDDARIRREIGDTLDAIRAAVPNARVPFFRAPGGNFAPNLNDVAASFDQAPLGWNVDPRDWEGSSPASIRGDVLAAVQPGSVVVLHDGGNDGSVEALSGIIEELAAVGYDFVVPAG